ncbi:GspE/PulE family protein [Patescibacteria group bacterium]|nr:GspE/PulE family protein [Patescibacteria group bacterium]
MPIFSSDKKQEDKMKEMRKKEAEDLAQILAKKYKLPYLNLFTVAIDLDALKIIPEQKAKEAKIVIFQASGKKLDIGVLSPNFEATQNTLKELEQEDYKTNLFMVSEIGLEKAWEKYREVPEFVEISKGIIDVSPEKLDEFIKKTQTLEDLKKLFSETAISKKSRKISEVLEIILAGAVSSDASDVHIEPQDNQIRLRFRLDGVLHDILFFDFKMYNIYNLLLSRIKLVSGLKLNIHDKGQDGRFSIHIKDVEVEVRTSIIPGSYGETIVMRILNPKSITAPIEELGIENDLLKILIKEIRKPNGMLLTTGPTGSGKTTTLYAFLRKIYSPDIKVITLEDPIEYHLRGTTQTQVEEQKGYTFVEGLRSILRQDPDVIMVGEIRDLETARIAMNAALTGHFVLSTLHTNNAAGTIPRLIDLGVNPNIIAPAINVSMAQRLIRKLCENCKEKISPSKEEKEIMEKVLSSFPKSRVVPKVSGISIWKSKGCPKCNNIGYKGRIGIFEAIIVDDKIEQLILQKPSETEIWKEARNQEILGMEQDGILKVLKGITSLDELQRVVEL